jgi:hypothetical protein
MNFGAGFLVIQSRRLARSSRTGRCLARRGGIVIHPGHPSSGAPQGQGAS